MSNPFDSINLGDVDGLEGLDGFLKKLKKGIRKIGKVVAPIVAGVVMGPAAGVAVAQGIKKHKDEKKAAKQAARDMGVSWGAYKKGEKAIEEELAKKAAAQVAQQANNPGLAKPAYQAIKNVNALAQSQQVQTIAQGMQQRGVPIATQEQLFLQSQNVQNLINDAVAKGVYNQMRSQGVSSEQAAVTANEAVKKNESSGDMIKMLLPLGLVAITAMG